LISQTNFIELRVSDKGIGIATEYREKVFDKFFRVPTGNVHNIKGYGLGLSYVNYIVKRHKGFIDVETELGKGSTFMVKLPYGESRLAD
jgi:two-component system, OmpR family, phosphate regulon sensor histidine kinase PhoR